jgi:uncharacterized protein YjiS (DUF1127 family)
MNFLKKIKLFNYKKKIMNELNVLSDYQLKDIGLYRCDIDAMIDDLFADTKSFDIKTRKWNN